MSKSDPFQPEPTEDNSTFEDAPSTEKQHKKIRTSPPVEDEDSTRLFDKHSFTSSSGGSPATTSPISTSPTHPFNNNNSKDNNLIRHDKDTTEENLYHKKANKQGKKNKKDNTQAWGTRLRTHPKPVVRFGAKDKREGKGESDEEPGDSQPQGTEPLSLPPPPPLGELPPSSPPSSPHPSDDVPLETLLKHGSGWTFPREQSGKMICIFRSCPQPLRGGTKKDYIDHLRLHQTMEHTLLYSMLRHAPPGGLLHSSDGSGDEESPVSQLDGEWEGEDEEGEDEEAGGGSQTSSGGGGGIGGGTGGGIGGGIGGMEEELHTPKLSQRGLQLRAQMMKYGLNIFRQDSEGRYLCFFMGCTMRMTTNFSRHIAKHEKKMDAISPDLVHLLKEGSALDKPYVKGDKKAKDGSPLTMMMASSHLIPPPHHTLTHDGHEMGDPHGPPPHHSLMSSMEIHKYHGAPPPTTHLHMQHSLQHMHLQASPSPPHGQFMQHISSHSLTKINLPPPPHPLSHSSGAYRHPPSHLDVHSRPPSSPSLSSSPTNPSEIRWVYRSPLPSPLTLPLTSPRRPSLPPPDSDMTPPAHSPLKSTLHHSFPPAPYGTPPARNPLSSLESPHDSSHPLSSSPALLSQEHAQSSGSPPHPSLPLPLSHAPTLAPPTPTHPDLGAVATSLLDLRKM